MYYVIIILSSITILYLIASLIDSVIHPRRSGKDSFSHAPTHQKVRYETKDCDKTIASTSANTLDEALTEHSLKLYSRAHSTDSPKSVEKYLQALELARQDALSNDLPHTADYIQYDIDEVRELLEDMRQDELEEKWESLLSPVEESLDDLICYDFENVDEVYSSKKTCVNRVRRFLAYAAENSMADKAIEGIRFFFPDCPLKNINDIEAEINRRIAEMKPVVQRKETICKKLQAYIDENAPLRRVDLLRKRFPDVTSEELSICYEALLAKGRINQTKPGKYYIVTSTQPATKQPSESKKTEKQPPQDTPSNKAIVEDFSSIFDLITYLDAVHIPYIDKTASNGCLWIESSPGIDELVQRITVCKKPFKSTTSSRHFKSRTAWYIK